MENLLSITHGITNTVEFELSISSNESVNGPITVQFFILFDQYVIGFPCVSKGGDLWYVTIPKLSDLDVGTYQFYISAIVDGYYFKALQGMINVTEQRTQTSTKPDAVTVVDITTSTEPASSDSTDSTITDKGSPNATKNAVEPKFAAFKKLLGGSKTPEEERKNNSQGSADNSAPEPRKIKKLVIGGKVEGKPVERLEDHRTEDKEPKAQEHEGENNIDASKTKSDVPELSIPVDQVVGSMVATAKEKLKQKKTLTNDQRSDENSDEETKKIKKITNGKVIEKDIPQVDVELEKQIKEILEETSTTSERQSTSSDRVPLKKRGVTVH